jgi:hypothetical protein
MITAWEYLSLLILRDSDSGEQRLHIWRPGADEPETRKDFGVVSVLNELGAQGWELVTYGLFGSVAFDGYPHRDTGTWQPATSYSADRRMILKRPVQG